MSLGRIVGACAGLSLGAGVFALDSYQTRKDLFFHYLAIAALLNLVLFLLLDSLLSILL